ncbi:hypothetical protein PYW07_013765 [Mythimna separata]|uniref:Uncharacterized protein n=1 Tax=Mythimna separata TaxID=271217 RepID=A0AAD7YFA9_MYTSE|nr:hypothetical protein PYW07_013765 [Mythimna separata]
MPNTYAYDIALSDDFLTVVVTIFYFLLTAVALLYAVTSWCLIKNFRNYRNFVYLNTILANLVFIANAYWRGYVDQHNIEYEPRKEDRDVFAYQMFCILFSSQTVKNFWSLIISLLFYVDFVKVFDKHIKRKYLISSLCGWVVPLILIQVIYFSGYYLLYFDENSVKDVFVITVYIYIAVTFLSPAIVNCIFYIITVSSVCCSVKTTANTTTSKCWRFCIAGLIFVYCNVSIFIIISLDFIKIYYPSLRGVADLFVIFLDPIVLNLLFMLGRSNMVLWHIVLVKKSQRNHYHNNITVNEFLRLR